MKRGAGASHGTWKRKPSPAWLKKNSTLHDATALRATDEEVWQAARTTARREVEALYNAAAQHLHEVPCCPVCAAPMTCQGMRPRWFVTLTGAVRVWRHYYRCAAHRQACAPFDAAVGLWRGYTPAVQRLVGAAAALTSFEEAALLLARMVGVVLDKRTVRDIALHLAQQYEDWQQRQQRDLNAVSAAAPVPARLYVELDAAKVPEHAEWKDAKVGVIFDVDIEEGVQRVGTTTYVAGLEAITDFIPRFAAHALRRNATAAPVIIALADGAPYNWDAFATIFPHAIQILDIYHAYDHLSTLRHACWHPDDAVGAAWYRAQKRRLKGGHLDAFFQHCDDVPAVTAEQLKLRDSTVAYFATNRARIRYRYFRRCGYYIGSGMVESACKRIVIQRLKLPGARWTHAHAHLMAQLRAAYLNGYLDQFDTYFLTT